MRPIAIFIEGLPGSGKTTFAKRLKPSFIKQGYRVKQFNEGNLNPIDLAWCALLTKEKFNAMIKKYPLLKDEFFTHSVILNDMYVFAFTQCNRTHTTKAFYEDMEQYEIYRTTDIDYFRSMHLRLWKQFDKNAEDNTIYIFESIYIQNHINELLLKYDYTDDAIQKYLNTLMNSFHRVNPILCHIEQKHVDMTIGKLAKERISNDKSKYNDWIDNVITYIKNQPYAKKYNYTNYKGIIDFFKARQDKTIVTLPKLSITQFNYILDDNYDDIYNALSSDINAVLQSYK
ncbi:MAG: hypothetical protein ACOC1L_07115 [Bacillota bacterium]